VQAHPEFTSKVLDPSPAYLGFVAASAGCLAQMIEAARQKKEGLVNGTSDASHFYSDRLPVDCRMLDKLLWIDLWPRGHGRQMHGSP
jgi:hypothetical protein